jgi:hypothetical protein
MDRLFSGNVINRNFKRNLDKLDYIILSSMRGNKHKKNYNSAAVLLISIIKPKVNRGNIRGMQKENFRRLYNKFARVVNNRATSNLAQKIVNNPYQMRSYFNRKNRGFSNAFLNTLAGKPKPNARRQAFGRPITGPNLKKTYTPPPRPNLTRRPPPRVNYTSRVPMRPPPRPLPRPNLSRKSQGSACVFKKLNAFGRPVCK